MVSGSKGKVFVEVIDPDSFMCNQVLVSQKDAKKHLTPFANMTNEEQSTLHRIAQSRKRSLHKGEA